MRPPTARLEEDTKPTGADRFSPQAHSGCSARTANPGPSSTKAIVLHRWQPPMPWHSIATVAAAPPPPDSLRLTRLAASGRHSIRDADFNATEADCRTVRSPAGPGDGGRSRWTPAATRMGTPPDQVSHRRDGPHPSRAHAPGEPPSGKRWRPPPSVLVPLKKAGNRLTTARRRDDHPARSVLRELHRQPSREDRGET